jgi:hypothetical protein
MGYETGKRNQKIIFYLVFWILMGMATLVKGPVALIELLIIIVYILIRREKGKIGGKLLAATFSAFVITVLPWVIMLIMHKDFGQYQDILEKTNIMSREGAFYYYVPAFIGQFFPLSMFMILSLPFIWRWRDRIRQHPAIIFCLSWVAVYTLIIHLTTIKHYRYVLPMLIPLSVIAGWSTDRIYSKVMTNLGSHKYWKVIGGILAGFVCIGPSAWIWINKGWMWSSFFLSIVGILSVYFVWKKTNDAVIFICILCSVWFLLGDLNRTSYGEERSEKLIVYNILKSHNIKADELLFYRTDKGLKRALFFYYNRNIREKDGLFEIEDGIRAVVTSSEGLDQVVGAYNSTGREVLQKNYKFNNGKINYIILPLHKEEGSLSSTLQAGCEILPLQSFPL